MADALTSPEVERVVDNVKAVNQWAEGGAGLTATMANGRQVPSPLKVITDSAQFKVAIAWPASTLITDSLQSYLESGVVYAPRPDLLPFTSGASFTASNWYVVQNATSNTHQTDITTEDILITDLSLIETVATTGFGLEGDLGSSDWVATGGSGSAGTTDFANGLIYDSVGNEFALLFHGFLIAEQVGAVGDGVTDDYQTIQDAITFMDSKNGGEIWFMSDVYAIGTTLLHQANGVVFVGRSPGWYQWVDSLIGTAATRLLWIGAAGGTMIEMSAIDGGEHALKCAGIKEFFLDGDQIAGKALYMKSLHNCRIDGLTIYNTTIVGFDMTVTASLTEDARDSQNNVVDRLTIIQQSPSTGEGMWIGGDATANTSINMFGLIKILYYNGAGVRMGPSDGNTFEFITTGLNPGGSGIGIILEDGAAGESCRKNVFNYVQTGSSGLVARAGVESSSDNVILFHSLANSSPFPTIEDGATLSYQVSNGEIRLSRPTASGNPNIALFRTDAIANDLLGKYRFTARNDAGSVVEYGSVSAHMNDDTAGSEDGQVEVTTKIAGVEVIPMVCRTGVRIGQSGTEIENIFSAVDALDFPSIAADGGIQELTMTVTGAKVGDSCAIGFPAAGGFNGVIYEPRVSAADTVTVRATNTTTGSVDPASQSFRVTVTSF